MSYQGGSAPGNNWPGNIPLNGHTTQSHHASRAPSQQLPSIDLNQDSQYWNPNNSIQYAAGLANTSNSSYSQFLQSPYQEPQYLSPAQIFPAYPVQPRMPQHQHSFPTNSGRSLSYGPIKSPSEISPLSSARMEPELDTAKLLISLAEEYFEAAHSLAPLAARSMADSYVGKYQELIATGLGCLETALRRVKKMLPRLEALIRLRYAGVIFEETENFSEAEIALSNGITLCERNHYFDLKYTMQFLLAQFMGKKNLKASTKALDGHIAEAEAYQHFSWVYAFRFLRVSHSLASQTAVDNHAAVQNIKAIATLARQQGDHPIHLAASLMEAMTYLRTAGTDALQNLQSALAAIRSHQMDESCQIPPLVVLSHIIDMAYSIMEGDPQLMMTKLQNARIAIDESMRKKNWSATSDIIMIPVRRTSKSSHVVSGDTRAILSIGNDGRDNLMLTFLNQKDIYCISCLLFGIILLHKSAAERVHALKYLNEGVGILEKDEESRMNKSLSSSLLPDLVSKRRWRGQVLCYTRIYLVFCYTLNAEWSLVEDCLHELNNTIDNFEIPMTNHLECLLHYLSGIFYQGSGDLDTALEIFQHPRFKIMLEKPSNISSIDQMEHDIAILAGLNALSILQEPQRLDPVKNTALLKVLEPVCAGHPNRDIANAFNLIMVTVKTNPPKTGVEVKGYLSAAFNGTRKTRNSQLLSITANLMFSRFFVGVLGGQAEKSAQAASHTAAKSGNPLWISVANRMLAACYELQGKTSDAQASMRLALKSAEKVVIKH